MYEHLLGLAEKRVGESLRDKWRLERVLGIGGMGSVYEARHKNGKRVAVKILHPHLAADPRVQKRFLREGYVANALVHPSVVGIDDNDIDANGNPFLVMELLRGESLEARRVREGGRLEYAQMLPIFAQLLDVLVVADDQGIVHRDLKPENLFLLEDGGVRVVDFGLARAREVSVSGASAMTNPDELMGTPGFMAPEQAIGRWDLVDPKTDVWAAGATMFTVLAGRPVHIQQGASMPMLLVAAATKKAPPLASVAPDIPAVLASVVDRALTFSKAERPDARTVLEELGRAARELGVQLPALPPRPRPPRQDDDDDDDPLARDTDAVPLATTPSDPFAATVHESSAARAVPSSSPPARASRGGSSRGSSLVGVARENERDGPLPAGGAEAAGVGARVVASAPAPAVPELSPPTLATSNRFPTAVIPVALLATLAGAALAAVFLRPVVRSDARSGGVVGTTEVVASVTGSASSASTVASIASSASASSAAPSAVAATSPTASSVVSAQTKVADPSKRADPKPASAKTHAALTGAAPAPPPSPSPPPPSDDGASPLDLRK